ncbi:BatD family protein, partial [Rothia aeria]|nr:BatD family protein [Rothia aeria]
VDSPIDYPNLKSFRVLDETNVRNFQVVNGQMQSSSGLELVLLAEKEGNYRIGPAKVVIDGRTYSTRTLDITVIERS